MREPGPSPRPNTPTITGAVICRKRSIETQTAGKSCVAPYYVMVALDWRIRGTCSHRSLPLPAATRVEMKVKSLRPLDAVVR